MKLWFSTDKTEKNENGDYIVIIPDFRSLGCVIQFDEMQLQKLEDESLLMLFNLTDGVDFSDKVDKKKFPLPVCITIHKPGSKY